MEDLKQNQVSPQSCTNACSVQLKFQYSILQIAMKSYHWITINERKGAHQSCFYLHISPASMEPSKKNASPTKRNKEKQKMSEIRKLSKEEKAVKAADILASRGTQALQIDPITPAKISAPKRSEQIEEKISSKKKKLTSSASTAPTSTFSQITKAQQLANMKIKVIVLWYKRLYSQSRPPSLTLIATDTEETFFEIIISDILAEKWSSRFEEGRVYDLKNIVSSENEKHINVIEAKFQMNITQQTKCIRLPKEHMNAPILPPLAELVDLPLVRAKESYLRHFILYVIDVRPLSIRTLKKGDPLFYVEVYVVDETLSTRATVLTVWENIVNEHTELFGNGFTKPFILTALGLKVKDFRGRYTLSASNFSKFVAGADANPAAQRLHEWVTSNFHLKILEQSDLLHPHRLLTLAQPEQLMTIRQMKEATPFSLADNQVLKFVVHATILDIDIENQIHYDACTNCNKSPNDRSVISDSCATCGKRPVTTVRRFLLTMHIGDSHDVTKITAFDKDAQEILYMTVEKALEIRSKSDGLHELRRIVQHSLQSSYTFTFTLNSQGLRFLSRSGYKVQMIDWIPRRCLRDPESDTAESKMLTTLTTSPPLLSDSAKISSGDSYIEIDSSSCSSSNMGISKSK